MESKETEKDLFKQAVRSKLVDKPIRSTNDAELWYKVLGELKEKNQREIRLGPVWYAAAALLLLFLSVGLGLYMNTRKAEHAMAYKESDIERIHTPDAVVADTQSEQLIVAEETGTTEVTEEETTRPEKKPLVQSAPDWSNADAIQSKNQVKQHELSDGSVVAINEGTVLKADPLFDKQRNVLLEGEAYFEVQPDKSSPFTVFFNNCKLVVVGTKFNVRSVKGEKTSEITVTEGIVRVFGNESEKGVEVKAGEQLTVSESGAMVPVKVNAANYIFWKTESMDFRKVALDEVATILSRKYKEDIRVAPQLKSCKFTGDLTGLNLDHALNIISLSISLQVEKTDKSVYLTGTGCD